MNTYRSLRARPAHRIALFALGALSITAGVAIAGVPRQPVPAPAALATSSVSPGSSTGNSARFVSAGRHLTRQGGKLAGSDRVAMIAIAGGVQAAPVSATGAWQLEEKGGRALLVRGVGHEPWTVERKAGLLRIAGQGDDRTPWREGPFIASPSTETGFVEYAGKRYRGELWFTATDSGVLVVNRLPVEEYLRGVVPLELGTRAERDRAAMEAQAIAARSYTYIRVPRGDAEQPRSGWHMLATVQNQVYGGVEVEAPAINSAVDATAGLVIRYGGLLVDAPYFASCGGRTAKPTEVWRDARDEPYLPGVDDTNPATGRPFCDISPRATWSAVFDESALTKIVMRHLRAEGARTPTSGNVTAVTVNARSASGRITSLQLATEQGDVTLSASEIRSELRDARGAILSSTYFSVDRESHEHQRLTGVTLRGTGNGHGVGMCQWGAIGRARAGQDFRTILSHYYPGTVVGFVD